MKVIYIISKKLIETSLPTLILVGFLLYLFGRANLDIPFSYDGDVLFYLAMIKTMIEGGSFYYCSHLGAPFGMDFLDFPGSDGLLWMLMRIITIFTRNPFVTLNVFYISGFVLVFYSTFWSLRQLKIGLCLSIAGAVIFMSLPYHYLRGVNHLFLATYFIVPLIVIVALRIFPGLNKNQFPKIRKLEIKHYIILIASGMCGIYYAFFSIITLFIIGIISIVYNKNSVAFKSAIIAILVVLGSVLVNLSPNIYYRISEGVNKQVAQRSPIESEVYGLRMTQMLLPIWGHKNSMMANINHRYQQQIVVTEATSSALGVISGFGFILLLLISIFGSDSIVDTRLRVLSKINLALVVFTTIGGIGVVFAMVVTPQFRGLNRASVFIAFFSLLTLIFLIQALIDEKFKSSKFKSVSITVVSVFLILVAMFDQIPIGIRGGNLVAGKDFNEDHIFIQKIESTLQKDSMVYQLPYISFPEVPPLFNEGYLAQLKPYLHSKSINWSFGAVRGRMGDWWVREVEMMPFEDSVKALESTGFGGIYINRAAYKDHGADIENKLKKIILSAPLEGPNGNSVFYKLTPRKDIAINPGVLIQPSEGFYGLENDGNGNRWIWADRKGKLSIFNFTPETKKYNLFFKLTALNSDHVIISQDSELPIRIELDKSSEKAVNLTLTLKTGENTLKFDTSNIAIKLLHDERMLGFRLSSVKVSVYSHYDK